MGSGIRLAGLLESKLICTRRKLGDERHEADFQISYGCGHVPLKNIHLRELKLSMDSSKLL